MLAVMLRNVCSRVVPACSAPARRSNSGQSTNSSTGSRPNHRATPSASPRSVMACPATTWKLAPIAAGRDSARLEGLGHVVGVHVVQHAQAVVGQREGWPVARRSIRPDPGCRPG